MSILTPTTTGWRSPDGYSFTIGRGRHSSRAIGELVTPAGERHVLAGAKHETAAGLLAWAEREILKHRAGGAA